MTDPVQPFPPARRDPRAGPGWLTDAAAAGASGQYDRIRPQPSSQRKGSIITLSILTAIMLLGLAVIVFLASTGFIRTPWQRFPPGTSLAGQHLTYGVDVVVSAFVGMPAAVVVIVIGHVALILLRRIPRSRPESREPGRVMLILLLSVCLATAYLALAMQVLYLVTYKATY
jgi:hypothetical protein